jgi:lipoate-protein ligase A
MREPLRLLIDQPLDGPTNMARDEAMLDLAAAKEAAATLRFYQWSVPTISLGYFQPYAELESLSGPLREIPAVRRITGGGAILHDRELTYSLVVPQGHMLLARGPTDLYCRMHDAIIGVLRELNVPAQQRGARNGPPARELHGQEARATAQHLQAAEPFFCFARAHPLDIVVGDRKLAGSAQRRLPGAVLQHGSIILDASHAEQPSAGVDEFCQMAPEGLAKRIAALFAKENGLSLQPDAWRGAELAAAEKHRCRYNDPAWTQRR